MLLIKSYHHFNLHGNVHSLRTENNKSPRKLWLEGILENYNTTYTAVRDIFDTNMTLREKLSEALQNLGVDLSASIINNNTSLPSSSFSAILEISEEQKLHLENIISLEEKCNREKYILCVNLLNS